MMQKKRTALALAIVLALFAAIPSVAKDGPPTQADRDLWKAVDKLNVKAVKKAVEAGADVNKIEYGLKPYSNALHMACYKEGKKANEIVKYLIEKGADVNKKTEYVSYSALSNTGDLETAKILIEKGAKVNDVLQYRLSPLLCQASYGNLEIVKLLIDKKASLKAKNDKGKNAIQLAEDALSYSKGNAKKVQALNKVIEYLRQQGVK